MVDLSYLNDSTSLHSVPFKMNGSMLAPLIVEAEKQQAFKQGARSSSRKESIEHSEFESMFIGILGEYAVALTMGLELPDRTLFRGGDGGVDLYLKDGRSVEVKTTCTTDYLIFNKDNRDLKSDIAILVKLKTPCSGVLVGWISKEEYVKVRREHDFQYGTRWVVHMDDLHTISSLSVTSPSIDPAEYRGADYGKDLRI